MKGLRKNITAIPRHFGMNARKQNPGLTLNLTSRMTGMHTTVTPRCLSPEVQIVFLRTKWDSNLNLKSS